MAESKSFSSRRSTETKSPATKNAPPPPRRSRSVSAVSRPSSDFVFKVENPLYCASPATSPPEENNPNTAVVTKHGPPRANSMSNSAPLGDSGSARGRTASRSYTNGKKDVAPRRSLSRAATEIPRNSQRSRSVSRGPVSRGPLSNSYSENEMQKASRNTRTVHKNNNASTRTASTEKRGDFSTGLPRPGSSANLSSSNLLWDDEGFSNFSESEVMSSKSSPDPLLRNVSGVDPSNQIYETVRSEVRRAIAHIQDDLENAVRRSNSPSAVAPDVANIPPGFVNSGAVELVLDIRREYASKLEQSQDRARKLRADLAVEEHRGLELNRILEEVLPTPKTSNLQKSRFARKSSIEKRKMSKRLTEDALAYFDECVSLSTFDSSDFSSPEDVPPNIVGSSSLSDNASSIPEKLSSHSINKPEFVNVSGSPLSAISGTNGHIPIESCIIDKSPSFSVYAKRDNIFKLQEISNYVKNSGKGAMKDEACFKAQHLNQFDIEEYYLRASQQNMWFDRFQFKNRIQSGSLLICGYGDSFL